MSRFSRSKVSASLVTVCTFVLVVLLGVTQLWSEQNELVQDLGSDDFIASNSDSGIGIDQTQETENKTLTEAREEDFSAFRDVEVSWRRAMMPSGVSPPYGPKYEIFRSKALESDADAAFTLFSMLDECKRAFATQDEVTAAVNEFRQTHLLQLPGWDKPRRMRNTEKLEVMVGQIESSFDKCYPITSEQKAERERWLEVAANGGLVIASVWYASITDDPEKSMNAALAAWDSGAAQALLVMRQRYSESYASGEDVRGNTKAFASLYAYTYLLSESRRNLSSNPKVEEAMQTLEAAKSALHDHQIKEAIEMAVDTIEANASCCIQF